MRKRTNCASAVGRPNVVLALTLGVQDGEERKILDLLDHDVCTVLQRLSNRTKSSR